MSAERPPPDDVRMRGFARRTPVEVALAWVDAHAGRLGSEPIPLTAAAGRVLAEPIASTVDVPAFARSMMDGYALRAAETQGASSYNRLPLSVVGGSYPGVPFRGKIEPGQAVRIMTGAALPAGADAVLPAEMADEADGMLLVEGEIPPAKHIGTPGEDIQAGQPLLAAGRRLRPQDLGALSSIGLSRVPVVRRPRVAILITGNEILPPGTPPREALIADANGPMLAALIERDGGEVTASSILPDDEPTLEAALGQEADVLLVSGGSSVGLEDFAPLLLDRLGELAIHGVAMRPSSPCGMGRIGPKLVFLLPGNPVSCLCGYDFFAGRAIRLLGGRSGQWPYVACRLPLGRKLSSQLGRLDYARVKVIDGRVEPLAVSGASVLSSTVRADGFVVIPAASEGYAQGSEVEVFLYEQQPR